MSIMEIEDQLILNQGSEALKKQFENHCEWCWIYGFGNCDVCKKVYRKYYLPLRIKELRIKNGFLKESE